MEQAMLFACMPAFGGDHREALLLALSLRRWGGAYAGAPLLVTVSDADPMPADVRAALERLGVEIRPFALPDAALAFPFAQKVFAAAAAEQAAGGALLAWMDPDSLILAPPVEFPLPFGTNAGCCPVQLKNISALAGAPVDGYWETIYAECGIEPEQVFAVTTTVDQAEVRAHFNAGLLVVRPEVGLMQSWKENFERLFPSPSLHPFYTADPSYRFFAHQAVLSATLLARLPHNEFQFFSPRINVPLFLRDRAPFLSTDPVTCRYDTFSWLEQPGWTSGGAAADAKIRQLLEVLEGCVGSREYGI